MNLPLFLFAVIAVFAFSVKAHGDGDHDHTDDVLVLNGENFESMVAQNAPLLVKFYAPWCGHCKKLAAPFAEAAHELHGTASLGDLDCTDEANKQVCAKYGIKGFPTLKIFDGVGTLDSPSEYQGQRTKESIVATMKKAAKPAISVVDSEEAFNAVTNDPDNSIVVALYHADGEHAAFGEIAAQLKNQFTFVIVSDTATADAHGASAGGVLVHRDFDEAVAYSGEIEHDSLKSFLVAESFPPLGDIGPENYKDYVDRGLPIVWCFFEPNGEDNEAIFATYTAVAKQAKGELSFVKLDGEKWKKHAEQYGVTANPSVVIEVDKKKYIYDHTRAHQSETEFGNWVQQYRDGELEPFVKSEDIPESQDEPVFVLVGKQYDEIVTNRGDKNVFVEYYAPWCGHCKKLAPTWTELGEKFADRDDVVIAKCDATANDVPEPIQGFPTLIFYAAGGGAGEKYTGGRDLDGLSSFLNDKVGAASGGHDEL
jgi:protein disulfide-isomerase A1